MKNKERDNKVAVSRSPATICSADGHRENAERDYAKYRADEVEKLFYGLGIRKHSKAIAFIVEREIREAVNTEREACAKIAHWYFDDLAFRSETKREEEIAQNIANRIASR